MGFKRDLRGILGGFLWGDLREELGDFWEFWGNLKEDSGQFFGGIFGNLKDIYGGFFVDL